MSVSADLVGSSPKFKAVLDKIDLLAPVDCSVLIQGETGTGKEVVAKAIHDASPRRRHRFVAVNCAAIPGTLLESELFGHTRGAFTGAVTQAIGRFQAADGGTLFLDEIGDLPLELQPKLLRVLQDREFEPLGSNHSIQVDVRVIAATNQDLWRMVQERKFREDLYYRMNVFPIDLPPLRDRGEDIPLLVEYFVRKFASRLGKSIDDIPKAVMQAFERYPWPGNIRELQNFVEHAVIMTSGGVLRPPLSELVTQTAGPGPGWTLDEAERAHITTALQETNWVIGGRNGAAARLGLPRTTLIGMMKRLGISRETLEPTSGQDLLWSATLNARHGLPSQSIEPIWPGSDQAVIRSRHDTRPYEDLCKAIVDHRRYLVAWIGFAENDPAKSVRIIARSGPCREYANALEVSWGEGPLGGGPTGTCIRSGKITVINDVEKDPRFLPWRERAAHYGCRSAVALPFRPVGKRIGILSLYASESHAFPQDKVSFFEELADEFLSQFMANLNREIRNPMNSIIATTNLLFETPLEPVQRDFLNAIRESADLVLTKTEGLVSDR
jgi:transcriptional regulator with AAA-type ATPase domain/putative methionine-R-sulfoxide reductase with GAF domain